ncbi:alpha-aminoadipate reductase [Pseudozyma hubeiensis SY62]|uniref:Alpha-aminoadipate reductase n=1 Tax=Pseudozyma hubeiensis (strain SY62) TaxID=1305764 RepID=R9PA67_PSEHS|nr:alpha-aminoadipate reductase [Pseudozyma hubeiensis SY62]GAC98261.1 alpha-aminoadipate reductase [Pseudozyma hubeiensis SY62]
MTWSAEVDGRIDRCKDNARCVYDSQVSVCADADGASRVRGYRLWSESDDTHDSFRVLGQSLGETRHTGKATAQQSALAAQHVVAADPINRCRLSIGLSDFDSSVE